jgi:hypothetical protein
MLSCVEDYWLTLIISHNKPPPFHSSPISYFFVANRFAHHSKLFLIVYRKLIVISQKYNLGSFPFTGYTSPIQCL